jgi:hypothetical protein
MNGAYIVKRPFKAAGKIYKPGDEFEPTGAKFDGALIKNPRYIEFVPVREDKTRNQKKVKHATD